MTIKLAGRSKELLTLLKERPHFYSELKKHIPSGYLKRVIHKLKARGEDIRVFHRPHKPRVHIVFRQEDRKYAAYMVLGKIEGYKRPRAILKYIDRDYGWRKRG